VRYVSTRGEAPPLDFIGAMLAGLAPDGGLYVPESWPVFEPERIAALAGLPYPQLAREILRPFVGESIGETDLARMIGAAYAEFRHPAVAPIVQLGPRTFMLELFHGPTLAFKDLALQLLARLMDHVLTARGERATVICATSGDTGGAAVAAFRGRKQVDVLALFPHGRISEVQRRMMTVTEDENVHALAIEGTFDDCQAIVKAMLAHDAFRDRVRLTAVNSINWARIAAQVVYYFAAAATLGAPSRRVAFAVPTGNFGDVFAGYVASRMGLPVDRLAIATNANDILVRALATGVYEPTEVIPTTSPSMDIQVSSNFERLLFDAYGRDGAAVRGLMNSLAQGRRFGISPPALAAIGKLFSAAKADERETAATIRTVREEADYVLDPHSAVAYAVAAKESGNDRVPMVVLATAHPAKFPDAVQAACGLRPELPSRFSDLFRRPERVQLLPADQGAVEQFILDATRTDRGAAA
jgi:threonine synthase